MLRPLPRWYRIDCRVRCVPCAFVCLCVCVWCVCVCVFCFVCRVFVLFSLRRERLGPQFPWWQIGPRWTAVLTLGCPSPRDQLEAHLPSTAVVGTRASVRLRIGAQRSQGLGSRRCLQSDVSAREVYGTRRKLETTEQRREGSVSCPVCAEGVGADSVGSDEPQRCFWLRPTSDVAIERGS